MRVESAARERGAEAEGCDAWSMTEGIVTHVGVCYPRECDQVGHMNVAAYVGKFDQATWNFFARVGMDGSYFRDGHGGMGAVDQHLTYRREVHPGDVLQVTTSVVEIRPKALVFEHVMTDGVSGEEIATCRIHAVHIDTSTRRSSELPDEVRARVQELLEG